MPRLKKNKYQRLYTEGSIQTLLFNKYFDTNSYLLRNKYVYNWESDFFYLLGKGAKASIAVEHEIKRTRSDWAKEIKSKNNKHSLLKETYYSNGENLIAGKKEIHCPNYYIITCPEGLISIEEVEDHFPYASLLHIAGEKFKYISKKKIHNVKQDYSQYMIDKLYNEVINHEFKIQDLHDNLQKMEDTQECCALINNFLKKNRLW